MPASNRGFLSKLAAPARRALEREDVTTLEKLATYSERDLLELHGMGPNALIRLRRALKDSGLDFRA